MSRLTSTDVTPVLRTNITHIGIATTNVLTNASEWLTPGRAQR